MTAQDRPMVGIGQQICDRCARSAQAAEIAETYLVEDPRTATGALCPDCAQDDDPRHLAGSWLLTWG